MVRSKNTDSTFNIYNMNHNMCFPFIQNSSYMPFKTIFYEYDYNPSINKLDIIRINFVLLSV
jgi:hypothetical protein